MSPVGGTNFVFCSYGKFNLKKKNSKLPSPRKGFFRDNETNGKKQIFQIQHNMVMNPSWQEADQLAIYKRGRGVELGATEKQLQIAVTAGPPDSKSGALTTRPHCLPNPGYRDEKCPKGHQNTRGTAFRPVSDLTSHAQLKMFRPGIRAGVFIWEKFEKFPARLPRSRSQKPRSRLPGQPAF